MNFAIFKMLAKNVRKVKWSDTATLNGEKVAVEDVDLQGKAAFDRPLTATINYREKDKSLQTLTGIFWPRDMQPEAITINGAEMPDGHVGFSGKYSFPASVKLILKFRWGHDNVLIVTGKTGLNLGLELLNGLKP